MLIDIGMPILYNCVRYNARVFLFNGRVVLIRPKVVLADDGNYRENRFFVAWERSRGLEEYVSYLHYL